MGELIQQVLTCLYFIRYTGLYRVNSQHQYIDAHIFINFILDLKEDGLVQRFFPSCPVPSIYMSSEIMLSVKPSCSLLCIFYYLYKLHESDHIFYQLSQEAHDEFCKFYDIFRSLIKNGRNKNTYITAVCGKAPSQLLRLAGILESLHSAFNYVFEVSTEKEVVNQNFIMELEEHLKSFNIIMVVNKTSMERAYNLLEYFNKTKLILSGFKYDNWEAPIAEIMETILNGSESTKTNEVTLDKDFLTAVESVEKKMTQWILTKDRILFTVNEINQVFKSRGSSALKVSDIFHRLREEGM